MISKYYMISILSFLSGCQADERLRKQQIRDRLEQIGRERTIKPYHGDRTSVTGDASGQTYYNSDWAGAGFPGEVGISQISGNFVVPNVTLASGDTSGGSYSGGAWIGIDGLLNECENYFMLGAFWTYADEEWKYYPFYNWYPSQFQILDFSIQPGETLAFDFLTSSPVNSTGGTWSASRTKKGSKTPAKFTGSISGQAQLCQETAQWITSTNQPGSQMLNFGTIGFSEAEYTALGNTYGPASGADIFEIVDNNVLYTNCAVTGEFGLSCTYGS